MRRFVRRRAGAAVEVAGCGSGKPSAVLSVDALSAQGVALQHIVILDFACGPGRVIGEFASAAEPCTLHGSDFDGRAIAWAADNLSSLARFSVNSSTHR